jgi:hypothetical protein
MKRAAAIEAIGARAAERVELMFNFLADGFEGTSHDRELAEKRFVDGLALLTQAEAFAIDVISKKFPE